MGAGAHLLASLRFWFLSQTQKSEGGHVGRQLPEGNTEGRAKEGGWERNADEVGGATGRNRQPLATQSLVWLQQESPFLPGCSSEVKSRWGSDPVPGLPSVSSPGVEQGLLSFRKCPVLHRDELLLASPF